MLFVVVVYSINNVLRESKLDLKILVQFYDATWVSKVKILFRQFYFF